MISVCHMCRLITSMIFITALTFTIAAQAQNEQEDFEEIQITGSTETRSPNQANKEDPEIEEGFDEGDDESEEDKDIVALDESSDDNSDENNDANTEEDLPAPIAVQSNDTKESMNLNMPTAKSRFISHPNAEKGLIKITKDRVYIYKAPPSPSKRAISVKFGIYEPINLTNPNNTDLGFSDYYEETSAPMVLFDYEWKLLQGWYGQFGFKAGSGIYVASGNGRFENTSDLTPEEQFNFFLLPNSLSLSWQGKFSEGQYIVPLLEAGFDPFIFSEVRDDDTGPKFGAALAFHTSAGLALSLTAFDEKARRTLASEYGINAIWLSAELRSIFSMSSDFDFSNNFANFGFIVQY